MAGMELDPNRSYTVVQRESEGYESLADSLLDQPSPTGAGQMYTEEKTPGAVLGNRKFMLLSCSKEDHDRMLMDNHKEAMGREYGLNDKGGPNKRNSNILEESSTFERTRSAISVD
jgi:hypothetical protein